ncbi:MAG TPA: histidine kinase [Thermoleophilaceae bacterium]|nr:histidine kinase [Thermoleophilaceae bacterium]
MTRVFLANAIVLTVAVLTIAISPASIPTPTSIDAAVILAAGLGVVLLVNWFVLNRALSPLDRLAVAMERAEPLRPGERVPLPAGEPDVLGLTVAFNSMLERLEDERRLSVRRSLHAQEEERRRVAQELHDEVGQTLTAVVLQLDRLCRDVQSPLAEEAAEARESARASLEDVRRIAHRLRPEALEELGLINALDALCDRITEQGGLPVERLLDAALPSLGVERDLVVYRVAQQALTNSLAHARATRCSLVLDAMDGLVVLCVADDGAGIGGARAGAGIQGMRERALLVGGRLTVRPRMEGAGTEVRLELPLKPGGELQGRGSTVV